jgi:CDP-glycerol glycerophosphotransferase
MEAIVSKKGKGYSPFITTCFFYLFRLFKVKRKKVVFCNYNGKGYGCNPKYIAEEILRRNEGYDLVWLTLADSNDFPLKIRRVNYNSIKAIYELATAGFWVDNQRKLPHNKKRKSQCFIETWHGGGGPIKKIGADNPRNINNKPYEKTSIHMDKIVDVMISNSKWCSKIYRSAFLYTGKILEYGYPRNDIFFRPSLGIRNKVYDYFKISPDYKIVLWAPTYRNGRELDKYKLDLERLIVNLTKKFNSKWTVLIRLHPTMEHKSKEMKYSRHIINASSYGDIQELLVASDVLISDYSSVISEFALTGKPIFLYSTDIKEYGIERDFYMDYYSMPFPIAESNEELEEKILSFNENVYREDVLSYLDEVGMMEKGDASARVVDYIENFK